MPFLYFAVTPSLAALGPAALPDNQHVHRVYVKFGHTLNCTKRLKTYGPTCKFAVVEYSYEISKYMPLDDYINDKLLEKSSLHPLVNFRTNEDSGRKTDWFTLHLSSANMILSYMKKIKALGGDGDYNDFSRYLLSVIIADPDDDTEPNIVLCMTEVFGNLEVRPDFFERNFKRGGMMPIKEMRRHPEWKEKYLDDAEVRDIHMCKSCPNRSHSGCCYEYSATNRKKIRMVIGWHC